MTRLLALLLACLALGLVACGSDDDDDSGGSGDSAQQPASEGEGGSQESGAGGGGGNQVVMENIQFSPNELTVKPGTTVTFTNEESVPHDVDKTGGPGPKFSSGPQGGMGDGDTYELTLDKPGRYDYVCRVHAPGMAGTITVK